MDHSLLPQVIMMIVIGVMTQWFAYLSKLPSILLLLLVGILLGPVAGVIDPAMVFGKFLLPFVSLSMAIILFEGGLNLRFRDVKPLGGDLTRLIILSAVVSWALGYAGARMILGFSHGTALIVGAILIITGPTVIIPLLRDIKPDPRLGSVMRWEGIINDPLGVMFAILMFELYLTAEGSSGVVVVSLGLFKILGIGLLFGTAIALLLTWLFGHHHVPDYLQSPFALVMALGAYTLSDVIQSESGLITVTIMGVVLGNQRLAPIKHVVEFKENLQTILLSLLFIVLAGRLNLSDLRSIDWSALWFLFYLVLVVRPLAIAIATLGSKFTWKERTFMAFLAPRGIVIAVISSIFGLELSERGFAEGERLVPLIFFIIIGTVLIYGLLSKTLAFRLSIAVKNPQGFLILGANRWVRIFAQTLQAEKIDVVLVDSNRLHIGQARLSGIPVIAGNILSPDVLDDLNVMAMGRFLAMTENDEINTLATQELMRRFGRSEVYQLPPLGHNGQENIDAQAQLLFTREAHFFEMQNRLLLGKGKFGKTTLTAEYDFNRFLSERPGVIVLLYREESGHIKVATTSREIKPPLGATVFYLEAV